MRTLSDMKDSSPTWVKDVANKATRSWGLATSPWRDAPDFLILGTKRGGTTSLWNNLLQHPQVMGMYPQVRGRKSSDYFFSADTHSAAWYRSHFPSRVQRSAITKSSGGAPVSGEASPYYMYGPHCPRLIAEAVPDVKALVLLRDPVERAYSHYQERKKQNVETLSFEDALDAEASRLAPDHQRWLDDPHYYSSAHDFFAYRDRGVYLPQIQRIQAALPAEQILILRAEDFYDSYQGSYDQVTDFLGVSRWQMPTAEHHNLIPRSPMEDATRAELTHFYAQPNVELEHHLGRDLKWAKN